MKKSEPQSATLPALVRRPRELVARLILAEALARRGRGPLARPVIQYGPKARRR